MSVRAKFQVASKTDAGDGLAIITLYPVVGGNPENESFFKATPGGSISLSTVNAEAAKAFEAGKSYYVDFAPAD